MDAIENTETAIRIIPNKSYLCDAHFESFNVGEMLDDKFKRILKARCKTTGKAKPDYRRAWKEKKILNPLEL